jgi:multidrug efflux system outer membrane protein
MSSGGRRRSVRFRSAPPPLETTEAGPFPDDFRHEPAYACGHRSTENAMTLTFHSMPYRRAALALSVAALSLLGACAATAPMAPSPLAAAPVQWQAPLPHGGRVEGLAAWWAQFDDPVLQDLVAAAQQASPSVATARSRVAQARAAGVSADAALVPSVQAATSSSRARQEPGRPVMSSTSSVFQASWELDLFGGHRAAADAAQARLDAAQAAWHDARVSVAAEVATAYSSLRACQAQLVPLEADAASRGETSRLSGLSADSGLQSRGDRELARASAAQASVDVTRQRAQCDLSVKALVALSAMDEPALRMRLAAGTATLPRPAAFDVPAVPAQALAQRPDLAGAERDVVAAAADVAATDAQQWPRIVLGGSVGHLRLSGGGARTDGGVWNLGPLSVTLPVFDAGVRRADSDAARARYDEAAALYAARLRVAVREVEEALVTLAAAGARAGDARMAADAYRAAYTAALARQRNGLASLFELEDARRSDLQSQSALVAIEQERVQAWIALYRALGGGWSGLEASSPSPSPACGCGSG